MLKKDKHFNTKDETDKSNVLYQIDKLNKKYLNTLSLNDIVTNLDKDLKDK